MVILIFNHSHVIAPCVKCLHVFILQVKLADMDSKVVRILLEYLYTGSCHFTREDLNLGVEVRKMQYYLAMYYLCRWGW